MNKVIVILNNKTYNEKTDKICYDSRNKIQFLSFRISIRMANRLYQGSEFLYRKGSL